jgi:hypothetical protein
MKISKLILFVLAIGCFSSAAFADSNWNDTDGILTSRAGTTGYFLSNAGAASHLTSVTGAGSYDCNPCSGSDKVSYTTGMTSGLNPSLINVLVPHDPTSLGNGTLTITMPGVGTGPNGTVFSGSFSNITWTYIGTCVAGVCAKGQYNQWEVQGNIGGTYYLPGGGTQHQMGFNVQLSTQKYFGIDPFASGTGSITGGPGGLTLGAVPESGTLILFGTGLVGIALFAKWRHASSL